MEFYDSSHGALRIADEWDYGNELRIGDYYFGRNEVLEIRDHLSKMLDRFPAEDTIKSLEDRVQELESRLNRMLG